MVLYITHHFLHYTVLYAYLILRIVILSLQEENKLSDNESNSEEEIDDNDDDDNEDEVDSVKKPKLSRPLTSIHKRGRKIKDEEEGEVVVFCENSKNLQNCKIFQFCFISLVVTDNVW